MEQTNKCEKEEQVESENRDEGKHPIPVLSLEDAAETWSQPGTSHRSSPVCLILVRHTHTLSCNIAPGVFLILTKGHTCAPHRLTDCASLPVSLNLASFLKPQPFYLSFLSNSNDMLKIKINKQCQPVFYIDTWDFYMFRVMIDSFCSRVLNINFQRGKIIKNQLWLCVAQYYCPDSINRLLY